jgi:hypothetical protein
MYDRLSSSKEFLKNNRLKIAFGALAVSAVVSMPSIGDNVDEIIENAPEVAAAIGISELLFISGIGMIAASQSKKVLNKDLISKKYIKDIVNEGLDNNAMLKSGLVVNTVGALGTGLAIGYGSVTSLPAAMIPSALAIASIDVAATVAIRYNIFKGLQQNELSDD